MENLTKPKTPVNLEYGPKRSNQIYIIVYGQKSHKNLLKKSAYLKIGKNEEGIKLMSQLMEEGTSGVSQPTDVKIKFLKSKF